MGGLLGPIYQLGGVVNAERRSGERMGGKLENKRTEVGRLEKWEVGTNGSMKEWGRKKGMVLP